MPYYSLDPDLIAELRVLTFFSIVGEFTLGCQLVAAYLLPTYIALARQLPDRRRIITCNLAWGWTIAGWIRAMLLATHPTTSHPVGHTAGPAPRSPGGAPDLHPHSPYGRPTDGPAGLTPTGMHDHDERR